jgi:hypothetical protein
LINGNQGLPWNVFVDLWLWHFNNWQDHAISCREVKLVVDAIDLFTQLAEPRCRFFAKAT